MSNTITIQPYSDKSVIVQGDYETYARQMKKFQARWNPRLRAGPGWLVPIDFESAVRSFFQLDDPEEDIRKSQRFRPASSKSVSKAVTSSKAVSKPIYDEDDVSPPEEVSPNIQSKRAYRDTREVQPVQSVQSVQPAHPVEPIRSTRGDLRDIRSTREVPFSSRVREEPRNRYHEDTDNEDIVSLARKMKDMMIRLERLEGN